MVPWFVCRVVEPGAIAVGSAVRDVRLAGSDMEAQEQRSHVTNVTTEIAASTLWPWCTDPTYSELRGLATS
jgi:hypothetical protein